jgi:hypothetical protein
MKLIHCVVALDAEGRTMGRVPVRRGAKPACYTTDDWEQAVRVSGEYTHYVFHAGRGGLKTLGCIEGLRGRYHKPAGFEVVSEQVEED